MLCTYSYRTEQLEEGCLNLPWFLVSLVLGSPSMSQHGKYKHQQEQQDEGVHRCTIWPRVFV